VEAIIHDKLSVHKITQIEIIYHIKSSQDYGDVSVRNTTRAPNNMRKRYQASLGAPDTSVEFQRVNSRICVAMMVFAQIYVAQRISSYLRDPENKTGALGWVKS